MVIKVETIVHASKINRRFRRQSTTAQTRVGVGVSSFHVPKAAENLLA